MILCNQLYFRIASILISASFISWFVKILRSLPMLLLCKIATTRIYWSLLLITLILERKTMSIDTMTKIIKIEQNVPSELIDVAKSYIEQSTSSATRKAYKSDFKIFSAWCSLHDVIAVPASAEAVALFLSDQANRGIAASTLTRRTAAIKFAHEALGLETPTSSKLVSSTMKGIRRSGNAKKQKAPATADRVTDMISYCNNTLAGKRDRAILLLGFAGAFRRSELAALTVADLEVTADGLKVTIRKSKTDQEGVGQVIAIPSGARLMVVKSLNDWLIAAQIYDGHLFCPINKGGTMQPTPLTCKSIALIVKKYAALAGLNEADFSGHSLRAGFLTSAAEAGATVFKLQEVSRHRSIQTLQGYVRSAELFKDHAGSTFL